jgi:hypothetical protein
MRGSMHPLTHTPLCTGTTLSFNFYFIFLKANFHTLSISFACLGISQEPYLGVPSFVHFTRFLVSSKLSLAGCSLQPARSVSFIRALHYKPRAF